ncbi:hypothetical protein RJG79_04780 [Mycoplasmatota bacterium WC44]
MQKDISRIGLKYDKKNRMIYINKTSQTIHVIDEVKLRKYEFFYNRYLFSFTLFLLISILNPYVSIAIGLASVVILEFVFRYIFLSKCRTLDTFVPASSVISRKPKGIQLIVISILYLVLGFTLLFYTFTEHVDSSTNILIYGISGFAIFSGLTSFKRIIQK